MKLWLLILLQSFVNAQGDAESCPKECFCHEAALSDLAINNHLFKYHPQNNIHNVSSDDHLLSYEKRNEVLDEVDEQATDTDSSMGEDKLKAAACVLNPTNNLPLFLALPSDLQVLAILQGPGTSNMTLDKSYFEHLQKLVVLEIHGFQNGSGIIRLRNDALKSLELLKYLNLESVHLLGDRGTGNRPAPVSEVHLRESGIQFPRETEMGGSIIPEPIQIIPTNQDEIDIVPYSVYMEEQERAGLSSFAGLKNLVFLRAHNCNIKEVNWEMFDGLQKLQYLSLEGNKIPFLHDFSFYGTPNLKQLILSHNKMLNVYSIALAGLLKLEVLDLSHNNITYLTEFSLPPFPQLRIANFDHNPLELILPHTFLVMNNTEQIYVGGRSAHLKISPNSFLGLDRVIKMSVNNIHLDALEREYLIGMPKLKELKMEGMISKLKFDAFAEVPKLEQLILRHCSIKELSMDTFYGLYRLVYLDLSHNEVESIPPLLFDQQFSLKEIILDHNKLTTLPQGLFMNTDARLIRLDKNPWHCSCAMSDWQPSKINKVRVKVTDGSLCQARYDKGSMCKIRHKYQYIYEQKVGPRCATPIRFSGWSVFHMLRKDLRCSNDIHKHKAHPHTEKHPKKGHQSRKVYSNSNSVNTSHQYYTQENSMTAAKTLHTKYKRSTFSESNYDSIQITTPIDAPTTKRNEFTNEPKTTETKNNELSPTNAIETNQYMWTNKDKQKLRLLQEKEERIARTRNLTAADALDTTSAESMTLGKNPETKIYKKSPTQQKWQIKMENTIRRLNKPTKK